MVRLRMYSMDEERKQDLEDRKTILVNTVRANNPEDADKYGIKKIQVVVKNSRWSYLFSWHSDIVLHAVLVRSNSVYA